MKVKNLIRMVVLLALSVMTHDILSQVKIINQNIDCDSLSLAEDGHRGYIPVVKMPSFKTPFIDIQNEFLSRVDTTKLKQTVYIQVYVDTCGNVVCPKIVKGNMNSTDTIALHIASSLKFHPAEKRIKKNSQATIKIIVAVVIPFYVDHRARKRMINKNGDK